MKRNQLIMKFQMAKSGVLENPPASDITLQAISAAFDRQDP